MLRGFEFSLHAQRIAKLLDELLLRGLEIEKRTLRLLRQAGEVVDETGETQVLPVDRGDLDLDVGHDRHDETNVARDLLDAGRQRAVQRDEFEQRLTLGRKAVSHAGNLFGHALQPFRRRQALAFRQEARQHLKALGQAFEVGHRRPELRGGSEAHLVAAPGRCRDGRCLLEKPVALDEFVAVRQFRRGGRERILEPYGGAHLVHQDLADSMMEGIA